MELGSLVPDKTYDLTLPLLDSGRGSVHLLLCLSGIAVNEDEYDGEQNDITEENYVSESVCVMCVCVYVCVCVRACVYMYVP